VSLTVCLAANTLHYPEGGGHRWVYLNWALGLRSIGCEVIWLEVVRQGVSAQRLFEQVAALKRHLARYDLVERIALCSASGDTVPELATEGYLEFEAALHADLLLNFSYGMRSELVSCFSRSSLIDIDPGLLQIWMSSNQINVAPHTQYFTIGEHVGQPEARFPDAGQKWNYTPPCVALDWWPESRALKNAAFTTVSHWSADEWMADANGTYPNDKRTGFLPFLDLPQRTPQSLELALCLGSDEEYERMALQRRGWHITDSTTVASTPWDYQHYIQQSLGEFSCVKPSCVRLQNAWISDRTLCYLASGKPAVVQHTGASRFLPDAAGLFRFSDLKEAARCLESAAADYERHCKLARALAEEYFDARKVVASVLERALN